MAPITSQYALDEVVDDSEPEREHCRQVELKRLNVLRTLPPRSQVDVIVITDDEEPGIIDLSGIWRPLTYLAMTLTAVDTSSSHSHGSGKPQERGMNSFRQTIYSADGSCCSRTQGRSKGY